ncbi:hypothetical protein T4A_2461 [Trichinella pseudospiralis]|uniref:Uncharacterized protein n=1 Tax=Trichinella pseudospiralis TaxID=6337 RepID=A0A0V1EFD3_TRIPS|nr:hypothetical protein T4A_2461 [Trichinella pseudospiralis]
MVQLCSCAAIDQAQDLNDWPSLSFQQTARRVKREKKKKKKKKKKQKMKQKQKQKQKQKNTEGRNETEESVCKRR